MRSINLLSLPTAVILLLCASPAVSDEQAWPYNLPKHMKYFPEDESHAKRGLSIQERLQREKPIGVKKMSTDEGEMFFLDNWIFAGDINPVEEKSVKRSETWIMERSSDSEEYRNVSVQPAFSPLRPHSEFSFSGPDMRFAKRTDLLLERDFKCPEGTKDCSSIGAPNSCCGAFDTCINVQDTGFGTVGCCAQGSNCAGSISCDTKNGYTSCPASPNGGCCLPGYSCMGVGCVIAGTSITTIHPSTTPTPTPSSSLPAEPTPTSTAVVVVPTTERPSSTPSPHPLPSRISSATCSSGWFSCPVSLGGGCCQNGLKCATGAACIDSTSTPRSSSVATSSVAPVAPVRPTSIPGSNAPITSGTSSTDSVCPTGFYVCSAYYPSGCCRIGRDCAETGSCVPITSTNVVASNGVTIAAPTGATFATTAKGQGGSCPSGWYSCAASLGGNCCLNGYVCGEQCTATASGNTQVAGKVAPSTASAFSMISVWALVLGAVGVGIGAVVL
ncbi:hypothetical protein GQ43DRAFT_400289 [Delitschia confertaspora ATCC 74209]|uniref:GPI anchored protein n=1 Tax=Delitschia confertaspora ATCC 74209 TaxID=1513339 RepID=A0A9P4JFZ3_9PLEO|nr:hypothetical protein GQ43DRAFT_400289 [Delitschia confertaspora ATCC 74209]